VTETLLNAYMPLVVWTGVGLLLFRWLPQSLPRLLGRALYWVGVPLQILALTRRADFSAQVGLAPAIALFALLVGVGLSLAIAAFIPQLSIQDSNPSDPSQESALPQLAPQASQPEELEKVQWAWRGSFILSSCLGNTGFIGLAVIPNLVSDPYLGWVVFYSITHNIVGTYGLGVFLSSYFGRNFGPGNWWVQIRDVLTVPSLWAFGLGVATRSLSFPNWLESGLQISLWIVIPTALLLMGMRLSQLQGLSSLKTAVLPVTLKIVILPGLVGLGIWPLHLAGDAQLAMVLMAGMPSAFANLILAEEYDLERELMASAIVVSTIGILVTIPLWIMLFGASST